MTHQEFVAAYQGGRLAVHVDPKAAARLVSTRMMLPLFLLPVFGIAVALALMGHLLAGILLFIATLAFRYFVRATARGFVLTRSLEDAAFYEQAIASGLLVVS
jgi:acyl dehydratase